MIFLLDLGVRMNGRPHIYLQGKNMWEVSHQESLKRHVSINIWEKRRSFNFLFLDAHIFVLRIYFAHEYPYRDWQSLLARMTTSCSTRECTRIMCPLVHRRRRLRNDSYDLCQDSIFLVFSRRLNARLESAEE
jgi:hypothetical protein